MDANQLNEEEADTIDLSSINPEEVEPEKVEIEEVTANMDEIELVKIEDLEIKENGSIIEKGTGNPFSGGVVANYENGKMKERYLVDKGLKHGPYEKFFDNGNLNRKCAYKSGKLHGSFKKWYESGKRASEGQFLGWI